MQSLIWLSDKTAIFANIWLNVLVHVWGKACFYMYWGKLGLIMVCFSQVHFQNCHNIVQGSFEFYHLHPISMTAFSKTQPLPLQRCAKQSSNWAGGANDIKFGYTLGIRTQRCTNKLADTKQIQWFRTPNTADIPEIHIIWLNKTNGDFPSAIHTVMTKHIRSSFFICLLFN